MPSIFHQKYATQSHKPSGTSATQSEETARRASIGSTSSDSPTSESPTQQRRKSSEPGIFANLNAIKRPDDQEHSNRRASFTDSKVGSQGIFGKMWNNYTRGPSMQQQPEKMNTKAKEDKDTTTLRF